jgi:hypothetical protein
MAPPLVIDEWDVDRGLEIIEECLDERGARSAERRGIRTSAQR